MAGGGEIPADIIIQQDYASKLARLVWNDEINDWVEPNRPPLLHYNIVLLSLGSECQQVTLLATRPLRGTGCGRVARSGEFLFRTLIVTAVKVFLFCGSRGAFCALLRCSHGRVQSFCGSRGAFCALLRCSLGRVQSYTPFAVRLAKRKLHPR